MNSNKRIHIHLGGTEASHSRDVNETKTVEALIRLLLASGVLDDAKAEDIFVFEEDSDTELARDFCFTPEHHGKRFHAHRCREIKVTFVHIDEKKDHVFRPGMTIAHLLKWAKESFATSKDVKYELRLSAESDPLPLAAHLGSYVKGSPCSLTLYFTPSCKIQG